MRWLGAAGCALPARAAHVPHASEPCVGARAQNAARTLRATHRPFRQSCCVALRRCAMAAPDFSAAAALYHKATELFERGHSARAAAKFGQALEAALAQRCPDCLLVAQVQLQHAAAAVNALCRETVSVEEYKARRGAALTEVLAAGATLQRRYAAGTLLGTSITAAELTWHQHYLEHLADLDNDPRVQLFRAALHDQRQCILPPGNVGARLRRTWQRLERSGMLQQRSIDQGIQMGDAQSNATFKAADAAAADPSLRACGLFGCGAREAHPDHFKTCAACRKVAYCCKEHQTAHWPSHKAACKAARKAKAADDDCAGPSGA